MQALFGNASGPVEAVFIYCCLLPTPHLLKHTIHSPRLALREQNEASSRQERVDRVHCPVWEQEPALVRQKRLAHVPNLSLTLLCYAFLLGLKDSNF